MINKNIDSAYAVFEEAKNKASTEQEKQSLSDMFWIFTLLLVAGCSAGFEPHDSKEEYLKGKVDAYENVIGRMF